MTYLISNLNLKNNRISPLRQFNNQWAVQKVNDAASVISNSCLHRGAVIVNQEQEHNGNISCPLHRWTYNTQGELMGEPFPGAKGCLKTFETSVWNNMIFKDDFQGIDIPEQFRDYFDLSKYTHTKTEVMTVNSSWQIFIEVYLDLYHVKPYHPGLGNFVDMDNFKWHFGDNWSIQEVMLNKKDYTNPNRHFNELEKMIAANYPNVDHGALWMTIYPNIMLEWYPNMLTVSTVWPGDTPDQCINIVEYHHLEEVAAFDQEFINLQIKAYADTADEDAEICELIQKGRTRPAEHYPTHPVLETGIKKFYEYLNTHNVERYLRIKDFE